MWRLKITCDVNTKTQLKSHVKNTQIQLKSHDQIRKQN